MSSLIGIGGRPCAQWYVKELDPHNGIEDGTDGYTSGMLAFAVRCLGLLAVYSGRVLLYLGPKRHLKTGILNCSKGVWTVCYGS